MLVIDHVSRNLAPEKEFVDKYQFVGSVFFVQPQHLFLDQHYCTLGKLFRDYLNKNIINPKYVVIYTIVSTNNITDNRRGTPASGYPKVYSCSE